jgi:hypothetical protein
MKCQVVSRVTLDENDTTLVVLKEQETKRIFAIDSTHFGHSGQCDIYSPYDRMMLSLSPESDELLKIDPLYLRITRGSASDMHHTRSDWKKAIQDNETDLGYWEWVSQMKEREFMLDTGLAIF